MSAPHPQHLAALIANDSHAASFQSLGQYRTALLKEIDKASAAPEQEPAAWANGAQLELCARRPYEGPEYLPGTARNIAGSAVRGEYCDTPLYTRPDPSEVEQLREQASDNVRWKAVATEQRGVIEAANQRADAAERELVESDLCVVRALSERDATEQKLGEAVGLLRDISHAYRTSTCSVYKILPRVDALLSASAEPATACESNWRDMATAPRDGTMLRLLVEFTENPTEDAQQAPTIGANNFENDGEDRWLFAGWCWSHDHFTQGEGEPIGWLPMLNDPVCRPAKGGDGEVQS